MKGPLTCRNCKHTWTPRSENPMFCPACHCKIVIKNERAHLLKYLLELRNTQLKVLSRPEVQDDAVEFACRNFGVSLIEQMLEECNNKEDEEEGV